MYRKNHTKIQQKNDIRKYVCHFSKILVRFLFHYFAQQRCYLMADKQLKKKKQKRKEPKEKKKKKKPCQAKP